MKLARMLMVRKDSRHTAIDMLWHEQEGLDALIRLHCIFDSLSHVRATIGCFQTHSIKWTPLWKGAKKPLQIIAIHDRKHLACQLNPDQSARIARADRTIQISKHAPMNPANKYPSQPPRFIPTKLKIAPATAAPTMPSTIFMETPMSLFMNSSASQPATPPIIMAAIQPTV